MFSTVLTLAGLALFLRLGWWQLDRAEDKRALVEQFIVGQQSTVAVTAESANSLPRYQRVEAQGRYDSTHQILLDNMPSQHGRAGYRVLTPLQLAGGGWLLIDRGWLAPGATRDELPVLAVDDELRTVAGRLDHLPAPGVRLDENPADVGEGWPRVMNFPRHATLQKALQRSLPERIVLLDANEPDGYERQWQMNFSAGPERHIGYAVQWFAFALVAVILYIVMSFRSKRASDERAR